MHDQENIEAPQSIPVAVEMQPEAEPTPVAAETCASEKGKQKSWWRDPNDPAAAKVNWKSWFDEEEEDDEGAYESPVQDKHQQDEAAVADDDDYCEDGEYSDDEGRHYSQPDVPFEGYCCRLCNVPGHWIQNCPTIETPQRSSQPGEGYCCRLCNVPGHWIRDCPTTVTPKRSSEPGEGYRCRLCNVPGHWIRDCPTIEKSEIPAQSRKCKACNASFASEAQLRAHVKQHVLCPEAGCGFAAAVEVVDEHFERYHGFALSRARRATKARPQPVSRSEFCNVCEVSGHLTRDCRKRPERVSAPPDWYVCKACGVSGHWIQKCTTREHTAPPSTYTCRLCGIGGHWIQRCPTIVEDATDAVRSGPVVSAQDSNLDARHTPAEASQVGHSEPANCVVLDKDQFEFFKRLESHTTSSTSDSWDEHSESGDAAAAETQPHETEADADAEQQAEPTPQETESALQDVATTEPIQEVEAVQEVVDAAVETEDVEGAAVDASMDELASEKDQGEDNFDSGASSSGDESESSTVSANTDNGIDIEVLAAALAAAAVAMAGETFETLSPKARSVKAPMSMKCNVCRLTGHLARNCPERGAVKPYEGYCCKQCNVPGHWMYDCPEQESVKQQARIPKKVQKKPSSTYVCKLCEVSGHFVKKCPLLSAPVPPESYVCKLCGTGGHWIKECLAAEKPVPPPSYLCKMCHVAGHWVRDCPNMDTTSPLPASYVCDNCDVAGHWIQACPKPRKTRETAEKQQRERSQSTSSTSGSESPESAESSDSEANHAVAELAPVEAELAPVEAELKPWHCETCKTSCAGESQLRLHISQHVECPESGCGFSATRKRVVAHAKGAHGIKMASASKSVDAGAVVVGGARVPEVVVRGKRFSLQEVVVDGRKCIVLAEVRAAA